MLASKMLSLILFANHLRVPLAFVLNFIPLPFRLLDGMRSAKSPTAVLKDRDIIHLFLQVFPPEDNGDTGEFLLTVWAPSGSPSHDLLMQPDRQESWAVEQILGGGVTPFRVWSALQDLVKGGGVSPTLMREVLPASDLSVAPTSSAAAAAAAAVAAAVAALALPSDMHGQEQQQQQQRRRRRHVEGGMEAISEYCSSEAKLNESQRQAVLLSAGPPATAQCRIHLIQVRTREVLWGTP